MKVALCQINIKFEEKEANKNKIIDNVREAKMNSATLCIFPEMTLTGFSMNVNLIGEENYESISFFKELCIDNNINIGFGWVKKVNDLGENHFTIISNKGEIICDYIKLHPFSYSDEDKYYCPGNNLSRCKINNNNIGVFICYDLRFPEIFQSVSNDVDTIIIIANWPKSRSEHWKALLKARAIENQVYILAVNCVGEINKLYYCGGTSIIDPNGNLIDSIVDVEGIIYGHIDEKIVKEVRKLFPMKMDRRNEFYKENLK